MNKKFRVHIQFYMTPWCHLFNGHTKQILSAGRQEDFIMLKKRWCIYVPLWFKRLARVSLLQRCQVACLLGISPCKTSISCWQGYCGHTYNTTNITSPSCRSVTLVFRGICRRNASSYVRWDLPDVLIWWFRYLARSEVLTGVLMTNQVSLDRRPCLLVIFLALMYGVMSQGALISFRIFVTFACF